MNPPANYSPNDPNIDQIVASCLNNIPSTPQSGIERTDWNEAYFFKNHFPKTKFQMPTSQAKKDAYLNLIHVFAGSQSVSDSFLSYFTTAIENLRSPANIDEYLFQDFMDLNQTVSPNQPNSEGSNVITPESTKVMSAPIVSSDYCKPSEKEESESPADNPTLPEEVGETVNNTPEVQNREFNPDQAQKFWTEIYGLINVTSDSNLGKKNKYAEIIVGLMCLHCLKLYNKSVDSVLGSMERNLKRHFEGLYNPDYIIDVIPPSVTSLEKIKSLFNAGSPVADRLVGICVGKSILLNAEEVERARELGVLLSGCLTHLSMYGLAVVKHFEQAAMALRITNSQFAFSICTAQVMNGVFNVANALSMSNNSISVNVFGQEIKLKSQMSWRFCRLFHKNHFNRFETNSNVRLIIRCAAFLACSRRGDQITKMNILKSTMNMDIYKHEVAFAQRYITLMITEGDKGVTPQAREVYKDIKPKGPDDILGSIR